MKKMSLQSLVILSFTLSIAIFEKDACQQSACFPQTTTCLWSLQRENRSKPAFKLCDVLQSPNESRFKDQNNNLGEMDDQIRQCDQLEVLCWILRFLNLKKKTDYKYMISFFFCPVHTNCKLQKIVLRNFSCV